MNPERLLGWISSSISTSKWYLNNNFFKLPKKLTRRHFPAKKCIVEKYSESVYFKVNKIQRNQGLEMNYEFEYFQHETDASWENFDEIWNIKISSSNQNEVAWRNFFLALTRKSTKSFTGSHSVDLCYI